MTTSEQLNKSFDDVFATAMRVKAERDALLVACHQAYLMLDDIYDAEQFSDGSTKEYPFNGAGVLMNTLKVALDKVTPNV